MASAGPSLVGSFVIVQVLFSLLANGTVMAEDDFYRAVVVEYSPIQNSSLDGKTNLMHNVHEYIEIVMKADADYMADVIVFPEIGLRGYGNQQYAIEVPNPRERVVPCAHDTQYEAPLVQLSCAAHACAMYVVVNLDERADSSHSNSMVSYNTDVVFDPDGAIVARYRKINLFDEGNQTAGPKELVYFDTSFGVRFGIFTCFDIIFQVPAVELARTLNISHFIFPTAWFSEMPFLTAIQEQWYWSYTLDVVLLGANYNMPNVGSTGSGIYLGRKGPAAYNMTEDRGTFMIYAEVPKNFRELGASADNLTAKTTDLVPVSEGNYSAAESKFILKRDIVDVYETEPITVPNDAQKKFVSSELVVQFGIERTICNGTLCCDFSIRVTAKYAAVQPAPPSRPDDYSTLHFRLAAFDGVRRYDHVATGGLQTCAILPCVGDRLASCGLPADDPTAETARFDYLYQTGIVFNSITISGNFSDNNTLVGPNILLTGDGRNFGSLVDDLAFDDKSDVTWMRTLRPVGGLVTASLYGRLFDRDGQPCTGAGAEAADTAASSPPTAFGGGHLVNLALTVTALVLIKIRMS